MTEVAPAEESIIGQDSGSVEDSTISELRNIGFIEDCVKRSNELTGASDYHIQLLFMRYDSDRNRQFTKRFYRELRKESKNELKVTYLVGFSKSDRMTDEPYFMQDGRYISFDQREYDIVHNLFKDLPEQKDCTLQIVVFKVRNGRPVIDDACECKCLYRFDKAKHIVTSDTELSIPSKDDGCCFNEPLSSTVSHKRPLLKGHGPEAKNLRKASSVIPGVGHIYLHQYKRGIPIIMINILLLAATLYYCYLVIVEEFKPASPMLLLISATIVTWLISIEDVGKVYRQICNGERKVDYDFLPSSEEPDTELIIPAVCFVFGFMMTFGMLRVMRIEFYPIEYILFIPTGIVLLIIGMIILNKEKKHNKVPDLKE